MKEKYIDNHDNDRVKEHWPAYGNRKKKDKARYKEVPCVTNKFKGHTHLVRIREKDKK